MLTIQNDSEIISIILQGNKEKYEHLIRKYNSRLYRVAKGILTSDAEIEDAMQEAYIKAYQQLAKFEGRSSFSTWITRILINECLMRQRKKVYATEDIESMTNSIDKSDMNTPELKITNNELKLSIEKAITGLPQKYRTVFVLREIENMSVAETTEILEITETNVKARLSRAKEMLRKNLLNEFTMNELFEFNLIRCDRIVANVFARIGN